MTVSRPTSAAAVALVLLLAGAVAATIALAAGPPQVTTGAASAVTASSATVGGTVNPAGSSTSYAVEYGPTTAYGTTTASREAGSGTSDVAVSVDLTGLSASTEYHYRLRATNADGTTVGADRTFTTGAPAPARPSATTGGASSLTATTARVSATINPQGSPTSVVFDYGTTSAYGSTTAPLDAGADSASRTISTTLRGLTARTQYHYRVRASNAGGETVGADRTFTTTPPPAPGLSTGSISGLTPTSAVLNGRIDPNARPTSAYVEYGTTTRFGKRTAATSVGAGDGFVAVALPITGLSANTTYHARLVAVSDAGTTRGSRKTFTTPRFPAVASFGIAPNPIRYGSSTQVVGAVGGTGSAGAAVTLVATPHPFTSPFTRVGSRAADPAGAFAFVVSPRRTTRYRVRAVLGAQHTESRTVRLSVFPSVGIRATRRKGDRLRFSGTVRPRGGGVVSLRKIIANGRIVTVKRTRTVPAGSRSRYALTIRAPRRATRYLVRVVPATRALVRGDSRVLRIAGR